MNKEEDKCKKLSVFDQAALNIAKLAAESKKDEKTKEEIMKDKISLLDLIHYVFKSPSRYERLSQSSQPDDN